MKFKPTPAQIAAALNVFRCKEQDALIKRDFLTFKRTILRNNEFRYADYFVARAYAKNNFWIPADRIIRDPQDIGYMQGMWEQYTPAYKGTDSDRFFALLNAAAVSNGYPDGLEVESKGRKFLYEAEQVLLQNCFPIHLCPHIMDLPVANRRTIINLLLQLLAPFVNKGNVSL